MIERNERKGDRMKKNERKWERFIKNEKWLKRTKKPRETMRRLDKVVIDDQRWGTTSISCKIKLGIGNLLPTYYQLTNLSISNDFMLLYWNENSLSY